MALEGDGLGEGSSQEIPAPKEAAESKNSCRNLAELLQPQKVGMGKANLL